MSKKQTTRYCIDCKWYCGRGDAIDEEGNPIWQVLCAGYGWKFNLVTGRPINIDPFASRSSKRDGCCGPSGKYFEAKEATNG